MVVEETTLWIRASESPMLCLCIDFTQDNLSLCAYSVSKYPMLCGCIFILVGVTVHESHRIIFPIHFQIPYFQLNQGS